MTIPSGCWEGTGGMACADDARTSPKATANNLIIVALPLKSPKAELLFQVAHQPKSGLGGA